MPAKKTKKEQVTAPEVLEKYGKDELIQASKSVFGVPRECVVAALRNVEEPLSVDEARKKLEDFMNMEVK